MEPIILDDLPEDHPLRNTILKDIGAQCRNRLNKLWSPCETWNIRSNTFNELRGPWHDCCEFRATKESL